MSRPKGWGGDVERGRLSARIDEEGRAAYEARFSCGVDESGGVREELELAPGLELLRYQRRLALEQLDAETQRAYRRRIEEAAR